MASSSATQASPAGAPAAKAAGRQGSWLLLALCAAALVAAPFVAYPIFLMKVLCFVLFVAAFNLLLGYVGLLSFGHAAFFGGSAYITAHAAKHWGVTPELAVAAGTLFAMALGYVFGSLAIRRSGIYFAMITLSTAQLFYFLCLRMPFTGGENGIQGVPRGHLLGAIDLNSNINLYFFVLAAVAAGLAVIWRIVNSPFGNILKAIRENEPRAISLGYAVQNYKLAAFVISAGLSGLAGGLKTLVFGIATLTDVGWQTSGEVILMTLVGGLGTLAGPVLGAGLVVAMQNYFASMNVPVSVLIGLAFIVCVLLFRRGIVGEFLALRQRRRHARQ